MSRKHTNNRHRSALELLHGKKEGWVPNPLLEKIAKCLSDPFELPFIVEEIINDEGVKDIRVNLARVQIDSELRLREDVEYYTQRLWAAQTIERMVFGGLMAEGEKLHPEDDDEDSD